MPPRRILGIDPGLHITGYGVIEFDPAHLRLVEAGVVKSRAPSLEERVKDIYDGVREVVLAFKPEAVSLEEIYSFYKRPRTAILMGHVRGAICLAAAQSGLPVFPYPATTIKKMLTGYGQAKKEQIQLAIARQFDLKTMPQPPDVADALAIALCHYFYRVKNTAGSAEIFTRKEKR